jgi:hypothetical protein
MDGEVYLPPVIGFTGKAGAGKDTLAAWLVENHGYKRYSLADPIKDLLNARFGWKPEQWDDRVWKEDPNGIHGCHHSTRDGYVPFSPRSWAQWLGTEVGRALAGQDVWVNALFVKAAAEGSHRIVIPDVRFDNEAAAIRHMGGAVIRVTRDVPGVAPHVSESGVDEELTDYTVKNSGRVSEATTRLASVIYHWSVTVGAARA